MRNLTELGYANSVKQSLMLAPSSEENLMLVDVGGQSYNSNKGKIILEESGEYQKDAGGHGGTPLESERKAKQRGTVGNKNKVGGSIPPLA
jgi:hypothetical protein